MSSQYRMQHETRDGDDAVVAQLAATLLSHDTTFPSTNDVTKAVERALMILDESRRQLDASRATK